MIIKYSGDFQYLASKTIEEIFTVISSLFARANGKTVVLKDFVTSIFSQDLNKCSGYYSLRIDFF